MPQCTCQDGTGSTWTLLVAALVTQEDDSLTFFEESASNTSTLGQSFHVPSSQIRLQKAVPEGPTPSDPAQPDSVFSGSAQQCERDDDFRPLV